MKKLYFILLLAIISFNCQKELSAPESLLPTIITSSTSSITNTTVLSGGNITNDGGAAITARGVCWASNPNPLVTGNHTTNGTGTGVFVSNITGLTANTTYYVRAYATNSDGTAYGADSVFTTTSPTLVTPTVLTSAITAITATTATAGGNVTADGGTPVTARGVCWSTTANPQVTGSHTTDGSGPGIFTSAITGLTLGTTYHVRAYATNMIGTVYGGDSVFTTTTTAGLATVTTASVGSITALTASSGGTVSADGGSPVTVRGICWATSANPVATGNHTTDGSGLGVFAGYMSGLTAGTTYHVRAYATNSVGTAYGGDSVFTTTSVGTPDVYVAGYESSGTGDFAKLWKNGVPTNLTGGTNEAEARSVFVSGTDVYVAGYEKNGTPDVAKLWKNGVVTNIAVGACSGANASGVFVSGSDVYISGSVDDCTNDIPTVWKNGIATSLSGASF